MSGMSASTMMRVRTVSAVIMRMTENAMSQAVLADAALGVPGGLEKAQNG
jgi:hypothetical protein